MQDTLRRICDLQPMHTAKNTPQMQERGILIRHTLVSDIRRLTPKLVLALGPYGSDLLVEGSDGKGQRAELPWVRLCSATMSPKATSGFYVVLHFTTDGSGVNIVVGCSSSKFLNGNSVVLPPSALDKRCEWARRVVLEDRGQLEPFTDKNSFGAKARLPKSFERASALVKNIPYADIKDEVVEHYLIQAAQMLRAIYVAQQQGRELSPADQSELEILEVMQPALNARRRQGFGLSVKERKAVELHAMKVSEAWLHAEGYLVSDTSASKPYDFEATQANETLLVEVKGTTSDFAESIAMTHGEVAIHKQNRGHTALLIVSGVRLDRSGPEPTASGGNLEVHIGWDIEKWNIEPTAFRVSKRAAI